MRPYRGEYPPQLWLVLSLAHERFISVQSDWARALAPEVALAASLGWLSNIDPSGHQYTKQWRITPAGLTALIELCPKAADSSKENI